MYPRRILGALVAVLSLASPAMAADDDWPNYHHSADHAGAAAAGTSFSDVQQGWTSAALDGAVYASPLYVGGRVLVATENNTVYAFDSGGGGTLWQTHLGDPVPASSLPCGNIQPSVGITSTPIVDTDSGLLYTVAIDALGHPLGGYFLTEGFDDARERNYALFSGNANLVGIDARFELQLI